MIRGRLLVWCVAGGLQCAICAVFGGEDSLRFGMGEPLSAKIPLAVKGAKEPVAELSMSAGAKDLTVRVAAITQKIAVGTLAEGTGEFKGELLVDDYNLDGWRDLAVPESTGYGGVVWYYWIYVYQPLSGRFVRWPAPKRSADDSGTFANPEPDPKTGVLETSQKSGPKWYGTRYRLTGGKPVLWKTTETIGLAGFAGGEDFAYQIEYFDAAGKLQRRGLSESEERDQAVGRTLGIERATLYDAPAERARTRAYIVAGDKLQLLERREIAGSEWFRIAYQSAKRGRIVKWILPGNEP